ncbi:phenylacetic acid degradation protein PaaY [Pandoraea terrae]|uniref:Phenylacetic acid degradation protein PaaY n=1 Tax=Pandoraea terrae TaxID=1537710 RepID=A0A5E4ZAU3_9BURK|nr:phenylacetic acid degradation protein PaaY [Pandoraea terrae]VVE58369.1 phenylacetic acid degradation protein PaaY [Pandoraea terrae]
MALYEFSGRRPRIHPEAFVHEMAVLIGDVEIGAGCYIGPCASLRGDFGRIEVGEGCNVQDGCVLHVAPKEVCRLLPNSHIGHAAVVHGAQIGRDVMIGMNAVIMDGAEIGEASIVAASAFVSTAQRIPPGVLVMGVPGRVVRALTPEEIAAKRHGTTLYQALARESLATMKRIDV